MDFVVLLAAILSLLLSAVLLILLFSQKRQLQNQTEALDRLSSLPATLKDASGDLKNEFHQNRLDIQNQFKNVREELANHFQRNSELLTAQLSAQSNMQFQQLNAITEQTARLTQQTQAQLSALRDTIDNSLKAIQANNEQKLEQMRQTVDEKLSTTLTARLDSSFKQVGDQLQQVYKGLGEMRQLATGVNDLQRVLTNVKVRGTWAEVQLGNLLEQTLAPDQYEKNVSPRKNSREVVEYAIKLPGKEGEGPIWLPIDAKFPQEDYLRLMEAADKGDAALVEETAKKLEQRIRQEARSIRDKYIAPPATTDFAVLFLPTEGLYAEILRRPGVCEQLQTQYRVVVAGPSTLSALLNSLRMGFQTLAIEKRSSEVWKLLSAVKTQYDTFTELLAKTKRKLDEASHSIENATERSRKIQNRLRTVEALQPEEAATLLQIDEGGQEEAGFQS